MSRKMGGRINKCPSESHFAEGAGFRVVCRGVSTVEVIVATEFPFIHGKQEMPNGSTLRILLIFDLA